MACPILLGTTPAYELQGSGEYTITEFGGSAVRRFRTAWTGAIIAARFLMGYGSDRKPQTFPEDQSYECYDVKIEPVGKNAQNELDKDQISYDYAIITALYKPKEEIRDGDPSGLKVTNNYLWSASYGTQSFSPAPNSYVWDDADAPDNGDVILDQVPLTISSIEWRATYRNLTASPIVPVSNIVGKVNQDNGNIAKIIYIHGNQIPEESLLCVGADITPRLVANTVRYDVTLRFSQREDGSTTPSWQKIYEASTALWYDVLPRPYNKVLFHDIIESIRQLQNAPQ